MSADFFRFVAIDACLFHINYLQMQWLGIGLAILTHQTQPNQTDTPINPFHNQYSKSSSTDGPLFFATLSCFLYISATILLEVASSGFLSSRRLMNLGNLRLTPLPTPVARSAAAARYLGLSVRSAVLTSHTNLGSNQTSGWSLFPVEWA